MKKRYILLILFFFFTLYILWCNISIIYTRKPNTSIALVDNIMYQKDSFITGNAAIIWQGFYHDWTYNHRLNRLGDWVQGVSYNEATLRYVFNHSAASGSGADVLSYHTYFTFLRSSKIHAFSSAVSATVRGREATTTTKIITVTGVLPAALKNCSKAVVLLNGFDLYCRSANDGKVMGSGNADKLSRLFMEVNNLKWKGDEFEFDLIIQLGADCDSPECLNFTPGDNEWFDYKFTVAYQLIGYNDGVRITDKTLKQSYKWFKPLKTRPDMDPNEIYRTQKAFNNKKIQGIPGYNIGVPAISKIDISLPKDEGGLLRKRLETPHLLSLDIAITDYDYNASTGLCTYDADLFFKNWKPNMHFLSYGNNGRATIHLGMKLLQISDASAIVEPESINGKINWETTQLDQRSADDPNSVKSFIFEK